MLRLTLELLPATDKPRRVLGVIEIVNVGGDNLHGDYVATISEGDGTKEVLVLNHDRRESPWRLVERVIRAAIGSDDR